MPILTAVHPLDKVAVGAGRPPWTPPWPTMSVQFLPVAPMTPGAV